MIDDFMPKRDKPRRIEPLERDQRKSIHELYDEHTATEAGKVSTDDESASTTDIPNTEEPFRTPEEIAAMETNDESDEQPSPDDESTPPEKPVPKKKHKFWQWHWRLGRKWTIALALVLLALVSTGSLAAYNYYFIKNPGGSFAVKHRKFEPKTVASNLSGLQVDPAINERPVTGVMIENSLDARPQSGLDQAGVVFEAIAEAGITRFLALFQDTQPDYIGPVRSVRPYYAQWCLSFDCALAHVGGSPEGLSAIRAWGVKDLDQFANSGAYWRISSRYAPHNMYTSISKLQAVEKQKGFGAAKHTPFTRKKETASKTPNATTINFNISSASYNSAFTYKAKTNNYARSEGGAPHYVTDGKGTKTQITPKVVIAMIVPYGLKSDGYHSDYNAVGTGKAYIFQDGTVQIGTWSKSSNGAALKFIGSDNKPIALNPGQTWITALGDTGRLTYK